MPTKKENQEEILCLLLKTEDIDPSLDKNCFQDLADKNKLLAHAQEVARKKELQGDSYGLLYASMAGFDITYIADAHGKNFIREWVNQTTGGAAFNDVFHPTPEKRCAFLRANMKAVKHDIDLFYIGARLYQLGRYEDALAFIEDFREKYPCREVFNNLGLIHYQMAVRALAQCDYDRAFRFKLATVLDTETRAAALRSKGGADKNDECPHKAQFEYHIKYAVRDLKTACEKDDAYLPARVNLASAHIMAGNYSAAKAIVDEALALNKDDAGAQNNHAVALYLLGPAINVDMFQQAADILKDTIAKNKQFAASYCNLGRIMAERGRNAAAKTNWEKYIQVEPAGIHAAMARTALGAEKATTPPRSEPEPPFVEPSPVKLGDYDTQTEKQLAGLVKHSLALGPLSVEYHTGRGMRVLVMEWVVEFAECPVKQKYSVAELKAAYGRPLKMFDSPSGVKTALW